MRRWIARLATFLTLLAAPLADAQQMPQNLPANTVLGRLGTGPGPGQAIPFSILSALFTQVVHSKLYAMGDGIHDDTAALQSWVNACQGLVPSTLCYLDSGYYKITSEISITNCINIDGAGRGIAFILPYTATQNTFHINTSCSAGRIQNIGIEANTAGGQPVKTAGSSILLDGVNSGWTFSNLATYRDFTMVTTTATVLNFLIHNLYGGCAGTSAICLNITGAGDSAVSDSYITNAGVNSIGIQCTNCDGFKVTGSKLLDGLANDTTGIGLVWTGTSSCTSCSDLALSNDSFEEGLHAIVVQQGTTVSMANVTIAGGDYTAVGGTAVSIANDSASWLANVSITGAVIASINTTSSPLVVGSASNVVLTGNSISGQSVSLYGISIGSAIGLCSIGPNAISNTATGLINDASGKCAAVLPSTAWTPVLKGAGTAGTPTYTTQVGRYVQNGNLITAWFNIAISAKTSIAGNLQIGGLPVTSGGTSSDFGSCIITEMSGMTLTTNYVSASGVVQPSVTNVNLVQNGSAQTVAALTDTNLGSTATLIGSCNYHN